MAYPAGVVTRPVTFGPAFELEDGDVAGMQVTFKATRPGVLWLATGQPAVSTQIVKNADDGVEQTVYLPVTDQEGWGDGDGNLIVPGDDGHVFLYIVTVIFTQNGRTIPGAQPRSKVVPIPAGDLSPLDLDKLIPLTTPGGTTVSVPDIWSSQIAEAQAAAIASAQSSDAALDAVAGKQDVASLSGDLATKLGTPADAFTVAVAAKIETAVDPKQDKATLKADVATKVAESGAARDAVDGRVTTIGDAAYARQGTVTRSALRKTPPVKTLLTEGAGSFAVGTASPSSVLADTTDFVYGNSSVHLYGVGTGATRAYDFPAVVWDLTGQMARVSFEVPDYTNLNEAYLYLGDSTLANYYRINLSEGASPRNTNRLLRSGEWVTLDIPKSDFSSGGTPSWATIQKARILISDKNATVSDVRVNMVGSAPEPTATLPNGALVISLDDSDASQWNIVKKYMDTKGVAGILFPILTGIGGGGALTLAQIKTMVDYSGWEVGGHAYDPTEHAAGFAGLTDAQVRSKYDRIKTTGASLGLNMDHFAWPNGDSDTISETACKAYFTTAAGTSTGTQPASYTNPYRLRRWNPAGMTLSQVQGVIQRAKDGKGITNLMVHRVVASGPTGNDITTAIFQGAIDYAIAQGIPIMTQTEVLKTLGKV